MKDDCRTKQSCSYFIFHICCAFRNVPASLHSPLHNHPLGARSVFRLFSLVELKIYSFFFFRVRWQWFTILQTAGRSNPSRKVLSWTGQRIFPVVCRPEVLLRPGTARLSAGPPSVKTTPQPSSSWPDLSRAKPQVNYSIRE